MINVTENVYVSEYNTTEQTVLAIILSFIILASLYGNGGVLFVLYRNDKMWNSTNILIGNLAITGVSIAALSMPFMLYSIVLSEWPFKDGPICKFNAFVNSILLLVTINIHMWISIDKYYNLAKPFSRVMTVWRTWQFVTGTWISAIVMSFGPLFDFGKYMYNRTSLVCGVGFPRSNLDFLYMFILVTVGFVIPNAVSIHIYFKVFFAVRSHSKRLHHTTVSCSMYALRLQKRLTFSAFFSLICLFLCWTPFAVYVSSAVVSDSTDNIPHGLGVSAYLSGYLYNAINPVVICFMSARYEDGLRDLTKKVFNIPRKIYESTNKCILGLCESNKNQDGCIDSVDPYNRLNHYHTPSNGISVEVEENSKNNNIELKN